MKNCQKRYQDRNSSSLVVSAQLCFKLVNQSVLISISNTGPHWFNLNLAYFSVGYSNED
jgi:hypothetical protein